VRDEHRLAIREADTDLGIGTNDRRETAGTITSGCTEMHTDGVTAFKGGTRELSFAMTIEQLVTALLGRVVTRKFARTVDVEQLSIANRLSKREQPSGLCQRLEPAPLLQEAMKERQRGRLERRCRRDDMQKQSSGMREFPLAPQLDRALEREAPLRTILAVAHPPTMPQARRARDSGVFDTQSRRR
jgi:hypothetical protein